MTLALTLATAAPARAQAKAVRLASGLAFPSSVILAPGDDSRLFITERRSGVRIIKDGVVQPDLFLDLSAELTNNEGIECLVFHPDYQNNGRFFLVYLDANQFSHVAEYRVLPGDPDHADPNFRVQILGPFQQPGNVHNWNQLRFGPDGMMYVATGDSVLSTDQTTNNSQDLTNINGKILRLDMDLPPPYIPPDNPFVGQPGVAEEIFLYGLRQPWRFCFDPLNGDFYVGDVGNGQREEIDYVPAAELGAQNFGWRCLEGTQCKNWTGGGCAACEDPGLTPPIFEYTHQGLCCIIGGEVYRGSQIPALDGAYFYSDFCSGRIWSFKMVGGQITEHVEWTAAFDSPDHTINSITSFGVDHQGELYFLDNGLGELYKIVPDTCGSVVNYCETSANSSGPGALISAAGSTAISDNDFTLLATGATPNDFGIFYYGLDQLQDPFGNGFRCVGGTIFRLLPATTTNGQGFAQWPIDFADPPEPAGLLTSGPTWSFQFWYRDAAAGGAFFNLSDALAVVFCP